VGIDYLNNKDGVNYVEQQRGIVSLVREHIGFTEHANIFEMMLKKQISAKLCLIISKKRTNKLVICLRQ